ncbi:MAG: large subunit ribosomal protein L10e [Candidatus Woesearchaeota archaeon]|jgi:large subunit ribosomal protein L10e
MAKVRKFVAYRRLERPYTRKSKYREKSFIRGSPQNKITRYNMGDSKKDFEFTLSLRTRTPLQIRDKAIESMRLIINRHSEKFLGLNNYYIWIKIFPHHHLRENALASGAGADRLSTGMKFSFGKVIGVAAQLVAGKEIVQMRCSKENFDRVKLILQKASTKLPCKTFITVQQKEA